MSAVSSRIQATSWAARTAVFRRTVSTMITETWAVASVSDGRTLVMSSRQQSSRICSVVGLDSIPAPSAGQLAGDLDEGGGRGRDAVHHVGGHHAARLAAGQRVGGVEHLAQQPGHAQDVKIRDRVLVALLLGQPGALPVPGQEARRGALVEVPRDWVLA